MLKMTLALLPATIAIALGFGADRACAQNNAAVDWGTPGNAVPCEAWQKNQVSEVWSAVQTVSINGKRMAQLVLGKDATLGTQNNINVWEIVDKACGKKG